MDVDDTELLDLIDTKASTAAQFSHAQNGNVKLTSKRDASKLSESANERRLKKQFNKTGQYLSEKIGAVEGTRLDDEFRDLERKSDLTSRAVEQLVERVKEYLQPNPATRAKMSALATLATLRGDNKQRPYPQVEGLLGEAIGKLGREMTSSNEGARSVFGDSLVETGESFKQLAEVKYSLEAQVGQSFFEPLDHLTKVELKEMHAHRRKLESRRLDFDGKKRKLEKGCVVPADELRMAEEKFEETRLSAEESMRHLLDNEVEQVTQLCELSTAMAEYYRQALTIVEGLNASLQVRRAQAADKARNPSKAKPRPLTSQTSITSQSYSQTLPTPRQPVTTNNIYGNDAWGSAPSASASTNQYNSGANNSMQNSNTLTTDLASLSLSAQDPFNFAPQANHSPTYQQPQQYSNSNRPTPAPKPIFGNNAVPVRLPPPPVSSRTSQQNGYGNSNTNMQSPNSPPPPYNPSVHENNNAAMGKALYDFVPENTQELAFNEGDMIQLVQRVDENWYEGRLNGRQGYFPVSYIQVTIPLQ